jgi:hypothetical protein
VYAFDLMIADSLMRLVILLSVDALKFLSERWMTVTMMPMRGEMRKKL